MSATERETQSAILASAGANGTSHSASVGRKAAAIPERGGYSPDEHQELRRLLSASWFGSGLRLIWECDEPAGATGSSGARDGRALIRTANGTAIRVALGLSAARGRLNGQNWILAVASADSLLKTLSHAVIEQLQGVDKRLALVVFDDCVPAVNGAAPSKRVGQFDVLDSRWLAELGVAYHGPVDGRNMASVQVLLRRIVQAERPALLHLSMRGLIDARAVCGDAAQPATRQVAVASGGAASADPAGKLTAVVFDELNRLAQIDGRVVAVVDPALGEAFATGSAQADFRSAFHGTCGDLLAEASGLALGGCRPFVVMSSGLLRRSLGTLAGETRRPRLPVTFVVNSNDESRDHGGSPSSSDVALLRLLPNMTILVPRDASELRRALAWSRECEGPVAIKLPSAGGMIETAVAEAAPLSSGRAEVLSEGFDIGLLALGSQVGSAVRAAAQLSEQGVSVAVVNARFVRPLDEALLEQLSTQVGGLLVLEEEAGQGGFGSAVLEWLAERRSRVPVAITSRAALLVQVGHPADDETILRRLVKQAIDLVERASGIPALYGGMPVRHARSPRRAAPVAHDPFGFSEAALRQEQELVAGHRLSAEVEQWYELYSRAGERRRYLWQWCERGAELTTLPCVSPELFASVCHTKVLSIMLCVLLDDVADQQGRERFLETLVKIVDDPAVGDADEVADNEREYVEITRQLSAAYHARVRGYPLYDDYADLLRYDQGQYFNTMRYSQLLNRNLWLLNPVEHDLYLPHAMDMMSFATIDLMCSSQFERRELGRLREALWFLQCMGRVGNLLSTWRREIGQHDFTSGVFARAVARGDLTVEELREPDAQRIEAAIKRGDHEGYYLRRWQYYRDCFLAAAESVQSVDMLQLLAGNERFFRMHLASRGLI
ncbi:MAG: transketolase C-terminal domain-containing protein [Planctomycetaceae bacterium]